MLPIVLAVIPDREVASTSNHQGVSRMLRTRVVAAAVASAAIVAAAPSAAAAKTIITASGSTTVAPLFTLEAKAFVKTTAGKNVQFKLLQGGSDVGVADVSKGRVTIGNSSRDQKNTDAGGLGWNKVARDALCISVNPANPITNLATNDIAKIFNGTYADWSDVPGHGSFSGAIHVVVRTAASGTQDAFQKLFMNIATGGVSTTVKASADAKASNGLVQTTVQSDTKAVGYLSLAFTSGTKNLSFNGTPCTLPNAKSGTYTGVRNLWMITRGKPTGAAKSFIDYVQSPAGQKIVSSGWVPIS